jgi:hypothetical protein
MRLSLNSFGKEPQSDKSRILDLRTFRIPEERMKSAPFFLITSMMTSWPIAHKLEACGNGTFRQSDFAQNKVVDIVLGEQDFKGEVHSGRLEDAKMRNAETLKAEI